MWNKISLSLFNLLLFNSLAYGKVCDFDKIIDQLYKAQREVPVSQLKGNSWSFNPDVDIDMRGGTYTEALETAFSKTGVPREDFVVTLWGKTHTGKAVPVEYRVINGPHKGAEVNMDWPLEGSKGPAYPHIGYQTPGKRADGGAVRGHILLENVPSTRMGK